MHNAKVLERMKKWMKVLEWMKELGPMYEGQENIEVYMNDDAVELE